MYAILIVLFSLWATIAASAQTDPRTLPLVQAGDVTYVGTFQLPAGNEWTWGWHALAIDGANLLVACNYDGGVGVVSIPAIGGTATVVTPCTSAHPGRVQPGKSVAIGGIVKAPDGSITISAYDTYNNGPDEPYTHITASSVAGLATAAPWKAGTMRSAMVNGPMGLVPPIWQALLGGQVLTGQCCISIVSRSSHGVSMAAMTPATKATSKWWVGYPDGHTTLGMFEQDPPGPYYGMSDLFAGMFIPEGTRSMVGVMRHGARACYGTGAACNDPLNQNQATHGYPYKKQLVAYDLAQVLTAANPWDVRPYAAIALPGIDPNGFNATRGATYNPATGRLYVAEMDSRTVQVFQVGTPTPAPPPPPPPTNCVGTWAESLSEPTPLACDATQVQTRTRTRTFTVVTPEANGGTCVERAQSPIVVDETSPCTYVPPPPPPVPTFVGRIRSQAEYTKSGLVVGIRLTLQVPTSQTVPAVGAAVRVHIPLANGQTEQRAATIYSRQANAYAGTSDWKVVVQLPGVQTLAIRVEVP